MSNYTSDYPSSVQVDSSTKQFFEQFYKTSDTPDAHEQYANSFTKDAVLTMASKRCEGYDEILALRKGMWTKVSSRKHNPIKIFPFGPDSDELMLYGTVEYEFKEGGNAGLDWAARAKIVKEGETVKMGEYQVYLDMAAQQAKK